jgi:hypothetical protein
MFFGELVPALASFSCTPVPKGLPFAPGRVANKLSAFGLVLLLSNNMTIAPMIKSAPTVTPTPMPAFAPVLRAEVVMPSALAVAVFEERAVDVAIVSDEVGITTVSDDDEIVLVCREDGVDDGMKS